MELLPTFNLLLKAIEGWYDNDQFRAQKEFSLSHTDFLREFRTISIDLGRRSGKTSSIKALQELYDNSYVIGDDRSFKRYLRTSQLGDITPTVDSIVFVDEPYKLFEQITEDDFYRHMSNARVGLIIMLGRK